MLGLMGKEDSELRCFELSQGWNTVNKDLLLPALIVGSYTMVTYEWAPVCSVTYTYMSIIHICMCVYCVCVFIHIPLHKD